MKTFRTKTYEIHSSKIQKNTDIVFAVLTDLHGLVFGEENANLIRAIDQAAPDAVLILGDMVVRVESGTLGSAESLLLQLAGRYPIFYALGNHEFKMSITGEFRDLYREFEEKLTEKGVRFLHNEKEQMQIHGTPFIFHGLELPLSYYHKPDSPKLSLAEMENLAGTPSEDGFHVLLAHNPKYGKTYFSWGADLTLCGHYHGGVMRLSEHHGLTCPQFLLFPPYCCGDFHQGDRHMIVSAGLGEHTIPIRIHNPRELLIIHVKPLDNKLAEV
jgi:predicted MPP superfamily phosphohydrolase